MTAPVYLKCACRHCGGHIEFPAAAAGQSAPCPHCGQLMELTPPLRRGALSLAWLMVGLLVLAAGGLLAFKMVLSRPSTSSQTLPPAAVPGGELPVPTPLVGLVTNGFWLGKYEFTRTPGSSLVYVTGNVSNLTDQVRYGVRLNFRLADSNQTSLGKASDYAAKVDAHALWHFKAMVMDSQAAVAGLESLREEK
ncbi:MAG TPA: FxLYD domain-containing protein [Verrucomicrobiae bacterium]